jgi:hypothetical protein
MSYLSFFRLFFSFFLHQLYIYIMEIVTNKMNGSLPLIPNKTVQIIKQGNGYLIFCKKKEITPGAYLIVSLEKDKWYTIDIECRRQSVCIPGLWIGTKDKKTLFFDDFFKNFELTNIVRDFFSGSYETLLVGILAKNAKINSNFFIKKLSIKGYHSSQLPKKNPTKQPKKQLKNRIVILRMKKKNKRPRKQKSQTPNHSLLIQIFLNKK